MVSTSVGTGWQEWGEKPVTLVLLPPVPPKPLVCALDDADSGVLVQWDGGVAEAIGGIVYTLSVVEGNGSYSDIYTGPDQVFKAVGLVPGSTVRFVVLGANMYGQSQYSDISDPVFVAQPPKIQHQVDDRPVCGLFMAGSCMRGSRCPLSHGTGLQTGVHLNCTPDINTLVSFRHQYYCTLALIPEYLPTPGIPSYPRNTFLPRNS